VEPGSTQGSFISSALAFLESITAFISMRNHHLADNMTPASTPTSQKRKTTTTIAESNGHFDSDPTQLLPTLRHTELMGVVSVLYGLLMQGAPERPTMLRSASKENVAVAVVTADEAKISDYTLSVALAVLKVLNVAAEMDIKLIQTSLGADGLSLEFRHICTYLLWYCVRNERIELLHQVVVCVGNFTLGNHDNQELVDSGAQPTVLQQLTTLPFSYFSNDRLSGILFPTLIACCHNNENNLKTLELEASRTLLVDFIKVKACLFHYLISISNKIVNAL